MSQEKPTIEDLQKQLQAVKKHRNKTIELLNAKKTELAKIDAQEKINKVEAVHSSTQPPETSREHAHAGVLSLKEQIHALETNITSLSDNTKKEYLEKKKNALQSQLEKVSIALDSSKTEMEKISSILEKGFDTVGITGKDQDLLVSLMLLRHMKKNENVVRYGSQTELPYGETIQNISNEPTTWLELDRGGKNGAELSVDEKGNVILTIDHHEPGGHIKPTSTAETLYLVLKESGYTLRPFNLYDTTGKNGVLVTDNDIQHFLELVNAQDNLTFTYSLEDLQTVYPASLVGIMHLLSPEDTLRLFILHGGNPYTEFTDEERKMRIREGKYVKPLSKTIAKQTEYIKMFVNSFEYDEKKSIEKWGNKSDLFGKTLLFETSTYFIPSHMAYAKNYDTIILSDTNKKKITVFSRTNNLDVAYERIHQKIPSAIFPRGIIIVPIGDNTLSGEELADIFGLSKEKEYDTLSHKHSSEYRAGDATVSMNIPETNNDFPQSTARSFTAEAKKKESEVLFLNLSSVDMTVEERRKRRKEIEGNNT